MPELINGPFQRLDIERYAIFTTITSNGTPEALSDSKMITSPDQMHILVSDLESTKKINPVKLPHQYT